MQLKHYKFYIITILSLLVILAGAFLLRAHAMLSTMNQGEYLHIFSVLSAHEIKDLFASLRSQMQPLFEYVLRKMLWFPLFGNSERSLRLPGMIYSLATIGIAFYYTWQISTLRLKASAYIKLLMSVTVASAIAISTSQIELLSEGARHYSLVCFLSIVWTACFIFNENISLKKFLLVSILFFNTHFFSLPAIATGYGWETLGALFKKNWKKFCILILSFAFILAFTILLNKLAWDVLVGSHGPFRPILQVAHETWALWLKYFTLLLPYPIIWVLCIAVLIINSLRKGSTSQASRKLLLLICVSVPIFLFAGRLKSGYPYSERYYSPFFGFLVFALIITLLEVYSYLRDKIFHKASWGKQLKIAISTLGLIFAMSVVGIPQFAYQVAQTKMPRMSPNFSTAFQIYNEIKALQKPLLIVDGRCDCLERPLYYLRFIGREPYAFGHQVVDFCFVERHIALARFKDFLKVHSNGVVIFEKFRDKCNDEDRSIASPSRPGEMIRITKTKKGNGDECVWIAENIRDLGDLEAAGHATDTINMDHFMNYVKNAD